MITWGEFKKQVEDQGVTNTNEISYINVDGYGDKIEVEKFFDGSFSVIDE